VADKPTIYLVPHFHYDPVWKEDQATYTRRAFELVSAYLDACEQDPAYHVILSEIDYLKPYWSTFVQRRNLIRSLAGAGRLHTGGSYSEPNEMSIQAEGIIRNIAHGRAFHERVIGHRSRTYLPLDVFGHVVQLPQILAKCGFSMSIWSKPIVGAPALCWALAPDGTRLLQKREPYGFRAQSLDEFWQKIPVRFELQQRLGLNIDVRLMGGDMAPPSPWLAGHCAELADGNPSVLVSGPNQYLEALEREIESGGKALPIVSRDLCLYHPGTAVSRAELKIGNRLCENALMTAEKFACFAHLLGAEYPWHALDKGWRNVLFGQHHDAITGTPCDIGFLDLLAGYREALTLATGVLHKALDHIGDSVDTAAGRPPKNSVALVVFNPLSWQRTDVCRAQVEFETPVPGFSVRDSSRKAVPCELLRAQSDAEGIRRAEIMFLARDVPSVGYSVYYVVPDQDIPGALAPRAMEQFEISNEFHSVRVSPEQGGGIVSIFDRRAKKEILNPGERLGNELVALKEDPNRHEPPWEVWTTGEKAFSRDFPCQVTVEESPLRQRIRVTGGFTGGSTRIQEVSLYDGIARIDFATHLVDYSGEHELIAACFPVALQGAIPVFEDRCAVVARKRSRGWFDFRTKGPDAVSECALYAAQNWVEYGNCVRAVCGRGQSAAAFPVGYTAIVASAKRTHRDLAFRLEEALAHRGITCTPWSDDEDIVSDRLYCTFRIALASPNENQYAQRLLESASERARQALDQQVRANGYGFVVCERADRPEGSEGIPELLVMGVDDAALEKAVAALIDDLEDNEIALPEQANDTGASCPADDYGVALINRGTLGASVENDGTMCLHLFHTASWPGKGWGDGKLSPFFVPEHKSHSFSYALYPHQGDWRQAGTVEAGYEYNNPLIARQAQIHPGVLPARHSFLSVKGEGLVVTTVKPKGEPLAEFASPKAPTSFICRLYESRGRRCEAALACWPKITSARMTDLLEKSGEKGALPVRKDGSVALAIGPCAIETVELDLARPTHKTEPAVIGPSADAIQPLHARYWEHNLGPAPIGNQAMTVTLEGQVAPVGTSRFTVHLTNDRTDQEAVGSIRLSAPQGWMLIPSQAPYRVPPGGHHIYEISVTIPEGSSPGFITACIEDGGQMIEDAMAVGEIEPVSCLLKQIENGWELLLENPNACAIRGRADLMTPLETWGAELVGEYARLSVQPMSQPFALEGRGRAALQFVVPREARDQFACERMWAVAKVMYHGRLIYAQPSR
jgi:alpha-mannosidase